MIFEETFFNIDKLLFNLVLSQWLRKGNFKVHTKFSFNSRKKLNFSKI